MNRTKYIVVGALMAAAAAIFQLLPALFSEAIVIVTMVSALPIYLASRLKPFSGILSFLVSAFLIFLVSSHEALFFLCTNGAVGLTLGLCRYHKIKKLIILLISSVIMTASLSILNFIIGIPIFGVPIPGTVLIQFILIFLFSSVYNLLYLTFSDFLYKQIKAVGIL